MHRPIIMLLALVASSVVAAPAIAPGDVGLRHDIQVLADYGVIRGPVTTWPLAWDAIQADIEAARDESMILPVAVEQTLQRIHERAERDSRRGQHRFRGRVAVAEKPARIRSFENTPRDNTEASASYAWLGDHVSINLSATAVDSPDDGKDYRADGSRIAVGLGNFTFAASTMDRWWGPG
ncbi:MAG: hypothetical protein O7B25_17660, partial [Gammaproteobacteria bacterium]|nr:hypothetical protein [Gammaproteobacteria bacterium]